jgi:cation:H+ antiporter
VVAGASQLGARFGLTPTVIGLTIVAGGTSAPELAVVFQSIAVDDTELAVGSIIGSNIANVLLILGLVGCIGAIRVTNRVVRIDIPIMIAASVAFLLMSLDGKLSRVDGIMLFTGVVVFVGWTLRAAPKSKPVVADGQRPTLLTPPEPEHDPLPPTLVRLVAGVVALAVASRFVVSGAEGIAASLGVPELIVGLTIVALGTSAPEIVTTVIAAMQGRRDLAVGNAVGSNIFNILLVLGATTTLAPNGIDIGTDAVRLDLPILVVAAVACLPIVFWDNTLDRWEGVVFVCYYLAYLTFLVLDATGHQASERFGFVMLTFVAPLTAITVAVMIVRQRRAGGRPETELEVTIR